MKKFIEKNYFIIFVIILAFARIWLTFYLTAYEIGNAEVDDTYMVYTAFSLKEKCWQGLFSNSTLIKGITAPFILNIISRLKISYIVFTSFFYSVSCIAIIYSLKNLIKNRIILLSIYIVILFNPVMFGTECIQRVYRNEFVPSLSLLIISCYFYIFNSKLRTTDIAFIHIITGILLGLFYNLREESIWIFPFITLLSISVILKQKTNGISVLKSIFLCCIPMIILIFINNMICIINYKYYGVYRRLDFISNPFERTYTYIAKIDYPQTDIKEGVSKEKLEFLFEISPTLNKYKKELLGKFEFYDKIDDNKNNGKVDNGWWQWTLRQSLANTEEYNSFNTADIFYNNVYKELKAAEKNGKIKLRKINYKDVFFQVLKRLQISLKYIVEIKEINSNISQESIYCAENPLIDLWYREITHSRFIYSESDINLYHLVDKQEQKQYLEKYKYVSNNLNNIINVYRYTNPIIFILAVIGYLSFTIDICKKNINQIDLWIIESSLIGTLFVLLFGYSYVHLTSFIGIFNYSYLSGTYALMLLFESLSIVYILEKVKINRG